MPLPYITIRGRSRAAFIRHPLKDTITFRALDHLISRVYPPTHARIDLSRHVVDIADIEPLIRHLEELGLARSDIRFHNPAPKAHRVLQEAIEPGLASLRLTLGEDVAERDAGLVRYFLQTTSFQNIAGKKRHIVLGPKGSGKTTIMKELSRYDKNKRSLVITPEHYATDALNTICIYSLTGDLSAFVTTWKYSLLNRDSLSL